MAILPEDADERVRQYVEYYERRCDGQPLEAIAQELGFEHPPQMYRQLRLGGWPVCPRCGETPAGAGHCGWLTKEDKFQHFTRTKFPFPTLSFFAIERMDELLAVGLRLRGAPPKQGIDSRHGAMTVPLPERAARKAWMTVTTPLLVSMKIPHDQGVYSPAQLFDQPPRTDKDRAIIAALTVLEGEKIEPELFWRLRSLRERLPKSADFERELAETIEGVPELEDEDPRVLSRAIWSLYFAEALLRHHRPEFDSLPEKERVGLLQQACSHINKVLEATRGLAEFLEHGGSSGRSRKHLADARRDVRAAQLRDVCNLGPREIGKRLGIPLTKKKGQYVRVNASIKRGREVSKAFWEQLPAVGDSESAYEAFLEMQREEWERWMQLASEERVARVVEIMQRGIPTEYDEQLTEIFSEAVADILSEAELSVVEETLREWTKTPPAPKPHLLNPPAANSVIDLYIVMTKLMEKRQEPEMHPSNNGS